MTKLKLYCGIFVAGLSLIGGAASAGNCFKVPDDQKTIFADFPRLPAKICLNAVADVQFGSAKADVDLTYSNGTTDHQDAVVYYEAGVNEDDTMARPIKDALVDVVYNEQTKSTASLMLDMDSTRELSSSTMYVSIEDDNTWTERTLKLESAGQNTDGNSRGLNSQVAQTPLRAPKSASISSK